MGLWQRLREWTDQGNQARVALVGTGFVGRGALYQLGRTAGMRPALVVNRTVESALQAFKSCGFDPQAVVVSDDPTVLAEAVTAGKAALASDAEVIPHLEEIDLVVEATGALDYGSAVVLNSLDAGKHVVSYNAELDATIGFLLHESARAAGRVYTIADGDQPGGMLRQIETVMGMGFEVTAAINCKRNLDVHQNPDTSRAYATRDMTTLFMTTAFGDGTKMNVENAVVANATGLVPDRRGMHGVQTTLENVVRDVLRVLTRRGVVEYTLGGDFAAGVGVIAFADDAEMVQPYLRYYKMGDGPDYFFFRPYHLAHIELPMTIAEVVIDEHSLSPPAGVPTAEVVALAKQDLHPGQQLDGIGGFTCYGQVDTVQRAEGLLPIGLAEHATVTRAVSQDSPIPLDSVEIDVTAPIVSLRRKQDVLTSRAR